MPEGSVYVGRGTRWGSPFKLNSRQALAREPAIGWPSRSWEFEGRLSADGARHDYHHGDGRITVVHVRYMTAAEAVECYRSLVTRSGWPLDYVSRSAPTVSDIRDELAGRDLVCWCPLDRPCHADVLLELANGGRS